MTPTAELRTQLRALLNERIPEGGTAANTRFSDADIDRLLEASLTINEAAWRGWVEKASIVYEENDGVMEKRVGSEVLKLTTPKDKWTFALEMAAYYEGLIPLPEGSGSRLFGFEPPEELQMVTPPSERDISRLVGHYEAE